MRCGAADAAECLHDHARPHLRDPRISPDGHSYRAFAPCHDDLERSLTVSDGGHGIVVWFCHACAKRLGKAAAQIKTRGALIRDGVPGQCLHLGTVEQIEFADAVDGIVFGKESHADKVLLLAAYLRGFGSDLPGGRDLRALTADCRASLRAAYDLREARGHGAAVTDNQYLTGRS